MKTVRQTDECNYKKIRSVSECLEGEVEKENGGRNWIRTSEGVSQQIYSLPPLATWVSYHP